MKITLDNYELYVLDYIEGTLDRDTLEEFRAFLLAHPNIAAEIEGLDMISLSAPEAAFPNGNQSLKKTIQPTLNIDESNAERYFIHDIEGLLTPVERNELQHFIASNSSLERDYQLYHNTKLCPDNAIVFSGKSVVKQPIPLWESPSKVAWRIAAALVVALGGITVWNALQTPVYSPRTSPSFTASAEEPIIQVPQTNPEVSNAVASAQIAEADVLPNKAATKTYNAPEKLERRETRLLAVQNETVPQPRPLDVYTPQVVAWPADVPAQELAIFDQTPELTLAQFIGKQVFGLDPNRTKTAGDFIREGLTKTLYNSDNIVFHSSPASEAKNELEFMAGNFEFKRITYK